ncbi:MAG TPA: hypothetical protein VGN17_30670 [Bryobacteraceae bacterium]
MSVKFNLTIEKLKNGRFRATSEEFPRIVVTARSRDAALERGKQAVKEAVVASALSPEKPANALERVFQLAQDLKLTTDRRQHLLLCHARLDDITATFEEASGLVGGLKLLPIPQLLADLLSASLMDEQLETLLAARNTKLSGEHYRQRLAWSRSILSTVRGEESGILQSDLQKCLNIPKRFMRPLLTDMEALGIVALAGARKSARVLLGRGRHAPSAPARRSSACRTIPRPS